MARKKATKVKARTRAAAKKVVKLKSKKPAAKAANGLPKPSSKPWGQAGKAPASEIISAAAHAGYDVSHLAGHLSQK